MNRHDHSLKLTSLLSVRGLEKRFGDRQVLSGLNLELPKGKVLTVSGRSGSGKTTLIRVVSGLSSFDAGEIVIGTDRILHSNRYPEKLHGSIGVVFQSLNLFPHMTALENVALAPRHVRKIGRKEALDMAGKMLNRFGLSSKHHSYPLQLSGGEKQRVAIARALVMEPLLMLLDEPTSSLDPRSIDGVLGVIRELASEGTSMIVVTHNLDFAAEIGNICGVIERGKLEVSESSDILERLRSRND